MKLPKKLWHLILLATIGRIFVASVLGFGNDEAYYYTYAQHLQWNYFDHPPGVAWLIRIFTFNLYFHNELFIRLGAIFFAAIGTVLSYVIGVRLKNQRTGWYAAILYNTSIYSSLIAGTFILPDSPQIVFWLAALLLAIIIARQCKAGANTSKIQWILFGFLNGICIMCKVHGIFLWIGLLGYVIIDGRKLLHGPGLYLGLLVTIMLISPIFLWNMNNGFATWHYHSQRVAINQLSFDKDGFLQATFGQLFYNNPINVFLILPAVLCYRKERFLAKADYRLLLFCGLPIILCTVFMSFFVTVLPHWSGPGFLTLSFIVAAYADEKVSSLKKTCLHWGIKLGSAFVLLCVCGGLLLINYLPGTFGSHEKDKLGEQDFTLDMYGWKQFGKEFETWFASQEKNKQLDSAIEFVDNKWFPAAHIDFYVAGPMHKFVYGVGNAFDLHQYVWLNGYHKKQLLKNEDALCIVPTNYPINLSVTYQNFFSSAQLLHIFDQYRSGKLVRYFYVYLLKNYKGKTEILTAQNGNKKIGLLWPRRRFEGGKNIILALSYKNRWLQK